LGGLADTTTYFVPLPQEHLKASTETMFTHTHTTRVSIINYPQTRSSCMTCGLNAWDVAICFYFFQLFACCLVRIKPRQVIWYTATAQKPYKAK